MGIERVKRRVYEIIEKRDRGDRASVVFNAFLVALIALNVCAIGLVALPTVILSTGFVEQLGRKRATASPSSPERALRYCPHCGQRLPPSLSPPEE